MSQSQARRQARRNKRTRTHDVSDDTLLCAMIIEHGSQVLDEEAPVPGPRVGIDSRIPWPGHGRPATTVSRYIDDEGI